MKSKSLDNIEELRSGKESVDGENTKTEISLKRVQSINFAPLKEINPDIVGWIRLEGSSIDYPVLRGTDNEFYLNHMYDDSANGSGSIFADYRNSDDFSDRNTVLYGHHMKNATMFNELTKYKNQEFYDSNPIMYLYTPKGDYLVELICGTVEDGN